MSEQEQDVNTEEIVEDSSTSTEEVVDQSAEQQTEDETQTTEEPAQAGTKEEPEKDRSDWVPYERFKQKNDEAKQAKALQAELDALKAQIDLASSRPKESTDQDLLSKHANDPIGLVNSLVERKLSKKDIELEALQSKLRDMQMQNEVRDVAGRHSDFQEYYEDIVTLLNDGSLPIDVSKPGAVELTYMIAKAKKSSTGRPKTVSTKKPHISSAAKSSKVASKNIDKLSLSELEKYIGLGERRE